MNEKLQALYRSRAAAHKEAQDLLTAAHDANRELTAEERTKTDELIHKVESMTDEIRQMQKLQEQAVELDKAEDRVSENISERAGSGGPGKVELRKSVIGETRTVVCADGIAADRAQLSLRSWLRNEREARATLQAGSDTGGGYFIPPLAMQAGIIQNADDALYLRQICNVLSPLTNADSLGVISLDSDPDDPATVGELATGSEDTSITFGMRELTPHPVARYVKLSKTLLRKYPAIEQFVLSRFNYKFARREEYLFLYGTGAGEPLGLMTASANGINTDRDVNTSMPASGTEVGLDGLKEVKYTLKPQYRMKAGWIFGTTFLKQVDKIKDGEGRYIWQPSVVPGQPDRLLNLPYYESYIMEENTTWTTGLTVGILGDFSHYWIVDSLTMDMLRLVELYAATNQIAWQLRKEMDGMPVLAEAFVRVKLA